jgi:hypothetical protein
MAGNNGQCFPTWQELQAQQHLGPPQFNVGRYSRVLVVQEPVITFDNNRNPNSQPGFFRRFSGSFGAGSVASTQFYIQPATTYDQLIVAAFESLQPGVGTAFPIAVRFGKTKAVETSFSPFVPGVENETWTGGVLPFLSFSPDKETDFPDVLAPPVSRANNLVVDVPLTNSPFTVWFWLQDVAAAGLAIHFNVLLNTKGR